MHYTFQLVEFLTQNSLSAPLKYFRNVGLEYPQPPTPRKWKFGQILTLWIWVGLGCPPPPTPTGFYGARMWRLISVFPMDTISLTLSCVNCWLWLRITHSSATGTPCRATVNPVKTLSIFTHLKFALAKIKINHMYFTTRFSIWQCVTIFSSVWLALSIELSVVNPILLHLANFV